LVEQLEFSFVFRPSAIKRIKKQTRRRRRRRRKKAIEKGNLVARRRITHTTDS
jgi:hypothetical protein